MLKWLGELERATARYCVCQMLGLFASVHLRILISVLTAQAWRRWMISGIFSMGGEMWLQLVALRIKSRRHRIGLVVNVSIAVLANKVLLAMNRSQIY